MKKAVHSSKLNPSNFVRRVLSRTSTHSRKSLESDVKNKLMDREKPKSNFEAELVLLKTQIDSLQITVGGMQNESERKEMALANLAKEKEILSIDLKKQKRSNNNLKQQLDDERSYYFKEKEKYCHEMNNLKKLKQSEHKRKESKEHVNSQHVNSEHVNITKPNKSVNHVIIKEPIKRNLNSQVFTEKQERIINHNKSPENKESIKIKQNNVKQPYLMDNTQKEIEQLRDSLNKTLEANYNLSVKFLRMKNTKLCIKTQLDKLMQIHDKAMHEYRLKLEDIQRELDDIVQTQFMKAIPPSNKKYLQIIKQNGSLMHENLILQLEVDRLNLELERMKMLDIRNDTNKKLKYIRHNEKDVIKSMKNGNHDDIKIKTHKNIKKHSKKVNQEYEIEKMYEKEKTHDMPCIKILPIDKIGQKVSDKESSVDIPKIGSKFDLMTISNSNSSSHTNDLISLNDNFTEMSFYTSMKCCSEAVRTQSAPEIVQSLNNNDT